MWRHDLSKQHTSRGGVCPPPTNNLNTFFFLNPHAYTIICLHSTLILRCLIHWFKWGAPIMERGYWRVVHRPWYWHSRDIWKSMKWKREDFFFLKKAFRSLCDQYGIALTHERHNRFTYAHYIIPRRGPQHVYILYDCNRKK